MRARCAILRRETTAVLAGSSLDNVWGEQGATRASWSAHPPRQHAEPGAESRQDAQAQRPRDAAVAVLVEQIPVADQARSSHQPGQQMRCMPRGDACGCSRITRSPASCRKDVSRHADSSMTPEVSQRPAEVISVALLSAHGTARLMISSDSYIETPVLSSTCEPQASRDQKPSVHHKSYSVHGSLDRTRTM